MPRRHKSKNTCEVKLKGQMAANESADGSRRAPEDFRSSACGDTKSLKKSHLACRGAVAIAAISLITAIILSSILFAIWGAAREEDPTFQNKQTENLQQCQKQCEDLKMMLHLATQDSRCRLCPEGWLWWRRHCYFFSVGLQENRRWKESAEFCQEHNSSLVEIKDDAEMDFLQGVMCNATKFPFLWVGLTDSQQEGRWLWLSGKDIQDHLPLAVHWDSDDRDCADLRGDGTLFAADCEEYGPWACKRES
ncbi:PREDICTED: CD209 antigen-like protein C [Poecilia mexicana]|uniref:CD209 antigen-like protein C n=1 Tax=Poecilia mexicana TaxID=48701 RepID=UPI00072EEF23|nr:PREDICTED: CD209 antigen-like protein C [Poecilia mexicana]